MMSETVSDSSIAFGVTKLTPQVRFLASLSDGRTVIQDNRPKIPHAWSRLNDWLKKNPGISITNLRLQGPKNVDISMPQNQKGYFLGHKHCGVWGGSQSNYIGIGYFDGETVNIVWHRQPLFDDSMAEERDIAGAGFFLIQNPS